MIKKLGRAVISSFDSVPYVLGYIGQIFQYSFTFMNTKAARKILVMQLLFTFIEALPLIAVLSTALGTVLFVIGNSFLLSIGQSSLIYNVLIIVILQELGPILVAFIVTARSATAIATELGGMVTTHQIESYVACGVDPVSHLAVPRFLGVTLSVMFLTLYFSFCGLVGPVLIEFIINPVAVDAYISGILTNISIGAIFTSITKSLIFGMVISITATFYGFNVERASTEVPVAGINAVGKSFLGIILIDVIFVVLNLVV